MVVATVLLVGVVVGVRSAAAPRREPLPIRPDIHVGVSGANPAAGQNPAIRDVHVVVYTTGWCPHCREAKAWMKANGVAYEERDIEASSDNARQNRSVNPRGSIPTFDVEGDVMVGFSAPDLVAMIDRAAQRHARQD